MLLKFCPHILQSNRIRQTTIYPIYQSHTNIESTRKRPCHFWRRWRYGHAFITDIEPRRAHCGTSIQKVGSASFVSGATLYFVLASPFHLGGPLHLQEPKFATTSARQHRERGMVGAFTPFYGREESLLMQGICATYRACPARARWGQNDRSVTHPTEYTLGGTPAIGTCPGRHSAARCHATGQQSPHSSFSLGQIPASSVPLTFLVTYLLPTIFLYTRCLLASL
jgi:hypothetical protein